MRQSDGYRAYLFDADGCLSQRVDLTCVDDNDAMMRMRNYTKMGDAELWHGTRLVCVFRHPKTTSSARRSSVDEE